MALRLALIYALVATLWIIFSDRALDALNLQRGAEHRISSIKGLLFVLVTAAVLWLAAARWLSSMQASEERYQRLFANSTEGLTVFRVVRDRDHQATDLVVTDVNPAQARRLGETPGEIVDSRLAQQDGGGTRTRAHLEFVASAAAAGVVSRSELYLEEDGRHELLTAFPIGAELWALAAHDVTDVRAAEEALRHQQEAIRQAYIDVLDAVTGGKLILLPEEDLAARLGEPLSPRLAIGSAAELAEARRTVRASVAAHFEDWSADKSLLSPVCEALNNALKHADGGWYQVLARGDHIQVAITDHGPGIDFRTLPKATLVPGFSTIASLGMGFAIMLQLCDTVLLTTGPGLTVVVLEQSVARAVEGEAA
jgi:anti-sigma regulatory factor (Ser/Thr protein kinase)